MIDVLRWSNVATPAEKQGDHMIAIAIAAARGAPVGHNSDTFRQKMQIAASSPEATALMRSTNSKSAYGAAAGYDPG